MICALCGGRIFVIDNSDPDELVWSHLEDTGCDDPVEES